MRLACELRPRVVIVENVAGLRGNGLSRVLGDLAEIRYDAEWHCLPASAVGAPHSRDRVWILAYLGQTAGKNWDHVSKNFHKAQNPIIAVLVLLIVAFVVVRLRAMRRHN